MPPAPPEDIDQTEPEPVDHSQPDFMLQAIVTAMNMTKGGVGVTILVGGQVVSGVMISIEQWLEEQRDSLVAHGIDVFTEPFNDSITPIGSRARRRNLAPRRTCTSRTR